MHDTSDITDEYINMVYLCIETFMDINKPPWLNPEKTGFPNAFSLYQLDDSWSGIDLLWAWEDMILSPADLHYISN